jgi:hypothetical protein
MKKVYPVILFCAALLIIWILYAREQRPLAGKPETILSAAKVVAPAPAVSQGIQKQEIKEAKSDLSQVPIPIPGQSQDPHQRVDADGVVLEEMVSAPDGKGKIKRRYSYGEDGRLLKAIDVDEAQRISIWDYSYDSEGKVHVRITDPQGRIIVR